jgi:hypothetical protein
MKAIRRLLAILATLVAAALLGAVPAHATNYPIDGDFAYQDGCRADQEVIYHKVLNLNGSAIGYVDLMYSVNCHAAWAHAHSVQPSSDHWALHAEIHRTNDGKVYDHQAAAGAQDVWSQMVYDKGLSSYAEIIIDPNGCCGVEYHTQTSAY